VIDGARATIGCLQMLASARDLTMLPIDLESALHEGDADR
jgi:hypothetical protein